MYNCIYSILYYTLLNEKLIAESEDLQSQILYIFRLCCRIYRKKKTICRLSPPTVNIVSQNMLQDKICCNK